MSRPDQKTYYMAIAQAVAARADCMGLKVGAVLVKQNRILSTGYNGTPEGLDNCSDGGCLRCKERISADGGTFKSGEAYDLCICVHAEANALLAASRFGIGVDGAQAYVTHQPCFGCSKELVQAGIEGVFYMNALSAPAPRVFATTDEQDDEVGRAENEGQIHQQLASQQQRLNGALRAVHFTETKLVSEVLSEASKLAIG